MIHLSSIFLLLISRQNRAFRKRVKGVPIEIKKSRRWALVIGITLTQRIWLICEIGFWVCRLSFQIGWCGISRLIHTMRAFVLSVFRNPYITTLPLFFPRSLRLINIFNLTHPKPPNHQRKPQEKLAVPRIRRYECQYEGESMECALLLRRCRWWV